MLQYVDYQWLYSIYSRQDCFLRCSFYVVFIAKKYKILNILIILVFFSLGKTICILNIKYLNN